MNYIDKMIEEKRNDIIQEGRMSKAVFSFFKGYLIGMIAPYVIVLAILIIIAPFIIVSNKINKEKLEKLLKNNPEFVKNFNKISQNIFNIFIKAIEKKNYFEYLPIMTSEDIFVNSRKNNNIEIGSVCIKLDSMTIFKDLTGCSDFSEYCDKMKHDDPDSEPDCEELKDFFKKMETVISMINNKLKSRYKGIRIDFNQYIDYEYLFSSLGIFESPENYPTICVYIRCNVDSKNLDEDIQKELKKTIAVMEPIIEKRLQR